MISSVISRLATGTYSVSRRQNGVYTNGRYVPDRGEADEFNITAVVQPYMGGRKMFPLPEGIRAEDTKLIHTTEPLRTRDNQGEADEIDIYGDTYAVWAVLGPYILGASTHYEIYASRRTVP